MIKVLIAEDQVLIQKDICKKIEKSEKNVEIAGTAMNGQDAYEKILTLHPDIPVSYTHLGPGSESEYSRPH